MRKRPIVKRSVALAAAAALGLLASACGGGEGGAAAASSSSSTSVAPSPSVSAGGTETVREIPDVFYQEDPDGTEHVLDVYVPTPAGGPWPVVVMLHGGGLSGAWLKDWATAVAEQGAVVFVPTWIATDPTNAKVGMRLAWAETNRMACVVRFARARAERYGGDPSNLALFGHSGGGNIAATVAFADPEVPQGCVARFGSLVPESLVLFEGGWLLPDPDWDALLAEDPDVVIDAMLPWPYLDGGDRMPVTILLSEYGADSQWIDVEDPQAWMTLRDPSGELGDEADQMGIFDDGRLDMREMQALLLHRVDALGYEASLDTLPESDHTSLSEEGLQVLVDVILQRT